MVLAARWLKFCEGGRAIALAGARNATEHARAPMARVSRSYPRIGSGGAV
jgi:hypothetical protein